MGELLRLVKYCGLYPDRYSPGLTHLGDLLTRDMETTYDLLQMILEATKWFFTVNNGTPQMMRKEARFFIRELL